jgi:hypothetical protein
LHATRTRIHIKRSHFYSHETFGDDQLVADVGDSSVTSAVLVFLVVSLEVFLAGNATSSVCNGIVVTTQMVSGVKIVSLVVYNKLQSPSH